MIFLRICLHESPSRFNQTWEFRKSSHDLHTTSSYQTIMDAEKDIPISCVYAYSFSFSARCIRYAFFSWATVATFGLTGAPAVSALCATWNRDTRLRSIMLNGVVVVPIRDLVHEEGESRDGRSNTHPLHYNPRSEPYPRPSYRKSTP